MSTGGKSPDRLVKGWFVEPTLRTNVKNEMTVAQDFNSPFGGLEKSGVGREHGIAGLESYLIAKTITIDPTQEMPSDVRASADVAPTPA